MWLIDTQTLQLREVIEPEEAGVHYAILSHTWGTPEEEVSFRDFADLSRARAKAGFAKIEKTCEIARLQRIPYAWVDTCCIDKSSSAELSEAINSMFLWYRLADICYVYLADLEEEPYDIQRWTNLPDGYDTKDRDDHFLNSNLARCRWFTRGWTLQELIAPRTAIFFDSQWRRFASKHNIAPILSLVTGIQIDVLTGETPLSEIPVFTRMSWAARRNTTRVEDTAYCLLGIFDINLPLIYGEGPKAFRRLQEEIIRRTDDASILAWSGNSPPPSRYRPRRFKDWVPGSNEYRGALAWAPCEFTPPAKHTVCDPLVAQDPFAPPTSLELKNSQVVVLHYACVIHRVPERPSSRLRASDILQIPCLGGYVYRRLRRSPQGHILEGPTFSLEEFGPIIDTLDDEIANGSLRLGRGLCDLNEVISGVNIIDLLSVKDAQALQNPMLEVELSMSVVDNYHLDKHWIQSQPIWPLSRWSDVDRCFSLYLDEISSSSEMQLVAVQHIRREFRDPKRAIHDLDIICGIGCRGGSEQFRGPWGPELCVTIVTRGSGMLNSDLYGGRMDRLLENARMLKPLHWFDRQLILSRLRECAAKGEPRMLFVQNLNGSRVDIPITVDIGRNTIDTARVKYGVRINLQLPDGWWTA